MRTTISLDDHLLAQVKKRASESGASVSGFIEQAVRLMLQPGRDSRPKARFKLITFGQGGRFTKYSVDKYSALLETEDVERCALRRRHPLSATRQ